MCNVAHPWFIHLTRFHTVVENRHDNVVRSLPISLVGMFGTVFGPGSLRIGTLLPAHAFPVAFLATVPALRDGFPLMVLIASTPPVSGGSRVVVGITLVPPSLILSTASVAHRLASPSTSTGPISLHVQHSVVGVRARQTSETYLDHLAFLDVHLDGG